ncbi:hypothetical protein DL770_000423 [Monosporascus sp. CRB-9-2]|nr:hypothetical protein DL770_000423 [Monosporascus sp. CRB-9-2]
MARPVVDDALQRALHQFKSILTDEQRRELHGTTAVPDADSVLVFTAQLDNKNRKGRSVASRLHTVLLSVQSFCSVVDTFVASHPEIAALVWGSVKLTMQIIVNYASYYEAVSELFMKLGKLCPVFAEYHALYPSSKRLQRSLISFHASIVRCCSHVVEAMKRPWQSQVIRALWYSFEQEFKPDMDAIQRDSDDVRTAIALAKSQADNQDQQLQAREREEASESRKILRKLFALQGSRLDEIRKLELQRNERQIRKTVTASLTCNDIETRLFNALTAYELREAISIEIGQQYLKRERLYNGIEDIATWCENLVQVDEEYETVQFAHHTVRQFLLGDPVDSRLAKFHVNPEDADHCIGEICVTYLNFNDFKTTLARQPQPLPMPSPAHVAKATLGSRSIMAGIVRATLRSNVPLETVDIHQAATFDRACANPAIAAQYPFLEYASTGWVKHARNFKKGRSSTWNLWADMVVNGHALAITSWGNDSGNNGNAIVRNWARITHHFPIICAIDDSGGFPLGRKGRMIFDCARDNDVESLDFLLLGPDHHVRRTNITPLGEEDKDYTIPPERAIAVKEQLLWAVDPPLAIYPKQTALEIAAKNGSVGAVKRLLAAGADVNGLDYTREDVFIWVVLVTFAVLCF